MISKAVGDFAPLMLPQLFVFSLNYPISKFLQSQRKMIVIFYISVVTLMLHALFSWMLILKLGWGLVSAGVVLNAFGGSLLWPNPSIFPIMLRFDFQTFDVFKNVKNFLILLKTPL